MTIQKVDGPALYIGYPWSLRIVSTGLFPAAAAIVSHVRKKVTDVEILTTLSTANGNIIRIDDDTIDITIPGDDSVTWDTGKIVLDFVRTDLVPHVHLGFKLYPLVVRPSTRGLT